MLLELEIDSLDENGAGTARATPTDEPLVVHVGGALPGEKVRANLVHRSPHRPHGWAELVGILVPSAARRPAACPHFGRCGGCSLLHLDEEAQREAKRRRLEAALAAHADGGPACERASRVRPVVASARELGYRAFGKYVVFRSASGRVQLGSYAPRSHTPVDMAGCLVVEPAIDEVARTTARLLEATGLALRYVLVRATAAGELLVTWVAREAPAPAELEALAGAARTLAGELPAVAGVVLNVNPERGDVLVGRSLPDRLLHGREAVWERVGELSLRLSARTFFQVNRAQAARLYAAVAEALAPRPGERVADLYAGAGGMSLTLALRGAAVHGVEVSPEAVADARASAEAARLPARFAVADAAQVAEAHGLERADLVVLNPPRKGCAPAALRAALGLAPRRLAYVSCHPETLARDLAVLTAGGYALGWVEPYDLFPQTAHVEALAVLDRA